MVKQTYNSNRVEEIIAGDGLSRNNKHWHQIEDGPKYNNRKLVNLVKIWVNKNVFTTLLYIGSPFVLISITRDEIWFLKVEVKRRSSKRRKD